MDDALEPGIERFAEFVGAAKRVLFITGAGLSADSGLPTYRGVGGLYEVAQTPEGVPIEVALSGDMMRARPELSWKYIHQIERACRGAKPNGGHRVIAALQDRLESVWVLTQNVDGFHGEAGSRNVIEIHGNLRTLRCIDCMDRFEVRDYAGLDIPPSCQHCSGLVRPEVVLFGEMLPEAATRRLVAELRTGFDLVVSIGTQSAFPYIAEPVWRAAADGVPTIEINPEETEVSPFVRLRIPGRAEATLLGLWNALR